MKPFLWNSIFLVLLVGLGCLLPSFACALRFDFEDKAQLKEFEPAQGKIAIEAGELVLTVEGAEGVIPLKNWNKAWTTYTMEVKGKVVDTGAGGGTGGIGLISRYQDINNMFVGPYLEMSTMSLNVQIKNNGAWGPRLNQNNVNIEFNKWYKFKSVVTKNKYEAYIDGKKYYDMTDDSILSGSPGLYIWKHKGIFDDSEFTGPGIPGLAVQPAGKLTAVWGALKK